MFLANQIPVKGMTCAACSARIDKIISTMEGVQAASVNLASEVLTVSYDPEKIKLENMAERVAAAGFTLEIDKLLKIENLQQASDRWESRAASQQRQLESMKNDVTFAFLFAIPLFILSMGEMMGLPLPYFLSPSVVPLNFALTQLLLTLPVLWAGRRFYIQGIPALFKGSPNMDSLVALGTGAAVVYSIWGTFEISLLLGTSGMNYTDLSLARHYAMNLYFESAAVLISLISLGKYFEIRSRAQTSEAIKGLLDLSPEKATLVEDGLHKIINAADIQEGYLLLIKPGERVPVDGVVVEGSSGIDESMLTGESIPVFKQAGDLVVGGTLNGQGMLIMKAQKVGADTVLARIVSLVQEAQGSKAPIASLADKFSLYFVPVVILLAILAASFWLWNGKEMSFAIRILVSVLVIACPCAMGLATPMSIMVGTGRGAQLGVLVKDGGALQAGANLDVLLLDKTGTLTMGKPELTDILLLNDTFGFTEGDVLGLAASVESVSEHPLAFAIIGAAKDRNSKISKVDSFEAVLGKGVRARITEGRDTALEVSIGSLGFVGEESSSSLDSWKVSLDKLSEQGKTVLLMLVNKEPVALFAVSDVVRPEAKEVIGRLLAKGLRLIMLTGDNEKTARAVANSVGITEVKAEVLPQDKDAVVASFQAEGLIVGMVGDGVNDAPALARANVGIALSSGIDVAVEAGNMVLMRSDLNSVETSLDLSRAVLRNIKENLFWAFGYNILGIPVAMGFLYFFGGPTLSPMFAGGAMALSSVSVVGNALRLRRFKANLK